MDKQLVVDRHDRRRWSQRQPIPPQTPGITSTGTHLLRRHHHKLQWEQQQQQQQQWQQRARGQGRVTTTMLPALSHPPAAHPQPPPIRAGNPRGRVPSASAPFWCQRPAQDPQDSAGVAHALVGHPGRRRCVPWAVWMRRRDIKVSKSFLFLFLNTSA